MRTLRYSLRRYCSDAERSFCDAYPGGGGGLPRRDRPESPRRSRLFPNLRAMDILRTPVNILRPSYNLPVIFLQLSYKPPVRYLCIFRATSRPTRAAPLSATGLRANRETFRAPSLRFDTYLSWRNRSRSCDPFAGGSGPAGRISSPPARFDRYYQIAQPMSSSSCDALTICSHRPRRFLSPGDSGGPRRGTDRASGAACGFPNHGLRIRNPLLARRG
jgi:hypothetical protein